MLVLPFSEILMALVFLFKRNKGTQDPLTAHLVLFYERSRHSESSRPVFHFHTHRWKLCATGSNKIIIITTNMNY